MMQGSVRRFAFLALAAHSAHAAIARAQRGRCLYGLCCLLWACSFDDRVEHCASDEQCGSEQECYRGYCIPRDGSEAPDAGGSSARPPSTARSGSGSGSGSGGGAGGKVGSTSSASSAAGVKAPGAASGGAGAGAPHAGSGGAGIEAPAAGSGGAANGSSAGANGPAASSGSASTPPPPPPPPMTPSECKPAPEQCNGRDDDCDGMIDEGCACAPGEVRSCYGGSDGTLDVGKCVAGTQTCTNGMLSACMNAVTPGVETCANQGTDDDCDGKTDDIQNLGAQCPITGAAGPCGTGKYQCEAGKTELSCIPVATPAPETCNGMDDDCNGKVDDTFDLMADAKNCGACGKACGADEACCAGSCINTKKDVNNCGVCGMKCSSGACNGGKCKEPDPPPPPPMDAGMPGGCQPACGAGQTCCNGSCVDTKTDLKHCGACGNACTGTQPGCCNSKCVDLVSNANCGQCGRDCSLLTNGGLTCTCTKAGDGSIACTGPVLNVCL